ncbi:MAG: hypothetical protein A2445_03440 [Candidatus Jacksonbacteria bacterium RIFOXYC2_FULL_44_29]|nr:MAG: hypothetical protein UW45_C0035G0004 [Parcubacteria group bacterium GW2011_GWC2_44_22]OGY74797.1 MAG: hypothetical protein A2240_02245 [Candidatus Jacksonbacteria bacterium RIFOXYA2_FULL_43_12]OGY77767.1 MAG: hypothetical protein A2295_03135 [Candidatus Jacksonbacteria bacterium RIFOXYB2_FULL_44_15]OGY78274.1 MAG: hypothetical protein A2445_03440 [Candidatus Jacksonbacteria bacterium RIFOXYC2_FULL_44_29]OGY78903.1 MAG: hypothetical protein A2550_05195 [Candidatus Jacksonbacteria bacteri
MEKSNTPVKVLLATSDCQHVRTIIAHHIAKYITGENTVETVGDACGAIKVLKQHHPEMIILSASIALTLKTAMQVSILGSENIYSWIKANRDLAKGYWPYIIMYADEYGKIPSESVEVLVQCSVSGSVDELIAQVRNLWTKLSKLSEKK